MMAQQLERTPIQVEPAKLEELQGIYAGGEAAPFQAVVENGQMIFAQPGLSLPSVPVAADEFLVSLGTAQLNFKFLRNKSGEVFGLRAGYGVLMKQ